MIMASMFFCIVISQLDSLQSLEEEKDLITNLSKFWIEMIRLMVTPGTFENIPTDCMFYKNVSHQTLTLIKLFLFRVAGYQYYCIDTRISF